MRVKLLFFASLRERFSASEKNMEMDVPMRVEEVAKTLGLEEPGLLFAVNEELVPAGTMLQDRDTLAFLMPVSGGAA
jgi:sulfur-carrier protein